jgi:hypothetical protein
LSWGHLNEGSILIGSILFIIVRHFVAMRLDPG